MLNMFNSKIYVKILRERHFTVNGIRGILFFEPYFDDFMEGDYILPTVAHVKCLLNSAQSFPQIDINP